MRINSNNFFVLIFLFSANVKGQFYCLPNEYTFGTFTEKILSAKDLKIHSSVKPYIHFFSKKYIAAQDSHRIYKYIKNDPGVETAFYNHLLRIESKEDNYRLRVDPIINFEAGRDFSDTVLNRHYVNTRGVIASGYIGNNFYIETMFAENQAIFPVYIATQNNASKVIPGQGLWKQFKVQGFDYAFSAGFISIQASKNFNIQLGHGKQKIGNGYRSLLLSDNAFNYPYVRFTHQWLKGKLQYQSIYSVLSNLAPASEIRSIYTERLYQKKAASFQYLSLNPHKSINLGFFQGMIWQAGDRRNVHELTWQYFNPIIYTNLVANELIKPNGINKNARYLTGLDLKIKLHNKLNLYGQLVRDHLVAPNISPNGYQIGVNYFDAFRINNLFLQVEYNDVKANTYLSKTSSITPTYNHFNQNIAYTPGNGKELVVIGDYKFKRLFFNLKYNYQEIIGSSFVNLINVKFGFVINPSYNFNIAIGYCNRNQNFYTFKTLNNKTDYIYVGLRTSLYNLFYDF